MDGLSIDVTGDVAHIRLDRPRQGNALDAGLVEGLLEAVTEMAAARPRLLLFSGQGRGFCGGFDFAGIEQQSEGDLAHRFLRIETLLQTIRGLPVTTAVLAHGYAWGAGADLFAACHIRIADPTTRFSFPGARFGIALGTGRLAALVGSDRARAIVLGGEQLTAAGALDDGLATEVLDATGWNGRIAELAADLMRIDGVTAATLLPLLSSDQDDRDMAALARSASRPGLKTRMLAHAAQLKAAKSAASADR